jgi:hypothetical protein
MKWVFPLAWFGFLAFFVFESLSHDDSAENLIFIVVPVIMAIVGYFFFKAFVWDLADSVYDHGTFLLVQRRGAEDRVPLENIMNVSSTPFMNPPRVTLRLVRPSSVFGSHISFSPTSPAINFTFSFKNAVAEQLIERAYAARAKRAG